VGDDPPLPLYVEERPPRRGTPARAETASVVATLRSVGRSAAATADRLIADGGATGTVVVSSGEEIRHVHGYSVTRHVLARPEAVVAAFDRWMASTGGHVLTEVGRLHPSPRPAPVQPHVLRVVPATLRLRGSLAPVPVELELVPWGTYRAALHLNLARRLVRTMGWHRRDSYFAAGHSVLELVRRWIEASIAE
jgi:hypothetical protein